jgi:DNA-binding NtrC family response regulator
MFHGRNFLGACMKRILVVEDEADIRLVVGDYLRARGLEVDEAETCAAAEAAVRGNAPDAAVLDYRLPDGDSLSLLPRLKAVDPSLPVVILTGHGSIELAVKAIQSGADHFLTKPVELPALYALLLRMLENRRTERKQVARIPRRGGVRDPFLGTSDAIRNLEEEARSVVSSESPILIHGETGAGKGVFAEWLYRNGARGDEAFVDLNCAGLSRDLLSSELFGHEKGAFTGAFAAKAGLFEVAHHGTVFLDEIGDMDPAVQAKLLKVIEEKRFRRLGEARDRFVDIQLIAATNQDLLAMVREKRFREDLYYRIGVIPLRMPSLRERPEDVPILARAILRELSIEVGVRSAELSADAEQALSGYRWPGNIRELRNALERAVLRANGAPITRRHLALEPAAVASTFDEATLTLAEIERRHIERALEAEGGHVERASKRLDIPRSTLYQKLKQMGISTRRATSDRGSGGSSEPSTRLLGERSFH